MSSKFSHKNVLFDIDDLCSTIIDATGTPEVILREKAVIIT
jgi:hypothetical protein